MADNPTLVYDGMSVGDVYREITKAGVSEYLAGYIAGNWVLENLRRTRRVFSYKEPFPAVDTNCTIPPWNRTFVHTDWTDGEDVVQAGETTGEEGFNSRFHKIEADLDRLGADIGKVFACLAEMRASVRKLLDEIRVEINLINSDIYECCNKDGVTVSPGFSVLNTGVYKGTATVLGKTVSLWETPQGMMMLPAIEAIGLDNVMGGQILAVADFAKFVNDDPRIKENFQRSFKLEEMLSKFGEETLPSGRLLKDAVKVLPPESSFESVDHMLDELSTWEAAVLRSREGARAAGAAALGLETIQSFGEAPVEKLGQVPAGARAALVSKGFATVADLAAASPENVLSIVKATGLPVTIGDVAGWTAGAKTLLRVGR